jgi:hypothetical protein
MDTIRDMIAAQRAELAEVLTGLPEPSWDEPTLCTGWRVREVVAHITMPFRFSGRRFALELAKSRGRFTGALAHDLIHGLDITVPLGLDRPVPEERLRPVLPGSLADRSVKFFGTDLDGIELRASDMDWTLGSGTPLMGTAADLLLVLCGRTLPPGRLAGEPSARFTRPGPQG